MTSIWKHWNDALAIIGIIMHFLKAELWQHKVMHTLYLLLCDLLQSFYSFTCYRKWFDFFFFLWNFFLLFRINKDNKKKVSIVIIFILYTWWFQFSVSFRSFDIINSDNYYVLFRSFRFYFGYFILLELVCVFNWSAWNAHRQ